MSSEALRSRWCTGSGSVCTGATTMLSPVCTPRGSTFSMEQTAMQVPSASRITSYSISCQPTRQRSTITWPMGLARRPLRTRSQYSSSVTTIPPPVPPSVKAGRTIAGSPICASAVVAAASRAAGVSPSTIALGAVGCPIRSHIARKSSRSSAALIAVSGVPRRRIGCRSKTPASESATARLSAVCPPSPASRPSGFSNAMMRSITSTVSGSR